MRLYLAQSFPDGWGGVGKTADAMKIYGALAGGGGNAMSVPTQASAQPLLIDEDTMTHLHLAERDPQHHGWPSRGVQQHSIPEVAVPRLRILLSYWYYKDTDLDALFAKYFTPPYPEVFADSGAFSAYSLGGSVDVSAYADWVQRYQHLFATYANLDVKGNVVAGLRNQAYLERRGLHPLPVFHGGEPWSVLQEMISAYPYIALGGIAGSSTQSNTPTVMRWLIRAFQLAASRAVYHGFGMTNWRVLMSFPWYSADSSSWGSGFRYGTIPLFDPRAGRFVKAHLGNHDECFRYARLFRDLGFDPADFADRKRNDRAKVCAISALSYLRAEAWLRKRHGEIRIPGSTDAPVGLQAHLADANPARFGEAQRGMTEAGLRTYLADTSNGINYGRADRGLKLHLADARGHSASEIASAESGLKIHLAEHSLDRGGDR